ncbi:MAG: MYXO-CTERM domain-containing protein [Myxococcota bacterium]
MPCRLLALLALTAPGAASAATLDVPSRYPTIAAALDAAARNDTIRVDGAAYDPERNDITVSAGTVVTIEGSLGAAGTSIPPVHVDGGELTLLGVTVVETDLLSLPARDNALVYVDGGSLTATDVVLDPDFGPIGSLGLLAESSASIEVDGLTAEGFTATAVWMRQNSTFELSDLTLRDNGGPLVLAGALVVEDASGTVADAWMEGNRGMLGGAVLITGGAGVTTFDHGSLRGNDGDAGAIWVEDGHLVLDEVDTVDNAGDTAGDLVVAGTQGTVEIFGGSFRGGRGDAGSLATLGPDLVVVGTAFSDSVGTNGGVLAVSRSAEATLQNIDATSIEASSGGLAHVDGGTLTVVGGVITDAVALSTGGAIAQAGGVVTITDTAFLRVSAGAAGAVLDVVDGLATLEGVSVSDASADFGGAISATDSVVTATGLEVAGAVVDGPGGALYATGSTITLRDSTFTDTSSARSAGAILVDDRSDLTLQRSRVCAAVSGFGSAAVVVDDWDLPVLAGGSTASFTNNVFFGTGDGAVSALALAASAGRVDVVNNTFLGNFTDRGSMRVEGTTVAPRLALDLTNNIFMSSPVGVQFDQAPASTVGGYNLWWDNAMDASGDTGFPSASAVFGDPDFQGYRRGDCLSNLWLTADSPARDAGDPSIIDSDGSNSDIGAFGGPDADLEDHDEDGVLEDLDCDDDDPDRFPGHDEVPDDGVDQDCDGEDEESSGGTGTGSGGTGGTGGTATGGNTGTGSGTGGPDGTGDPNDDDDLDPSDLSSIDTWISGGCACSTSAPGGAPWPIAVLLLLTLRRRNGR